MSFPLPSPLSLISLLSILLPLCSSSFSSSTSSYEVSSVTVFYYPLHFLDLLCFTPSSLIKELSPLLSPSLTFFLLLYALCDSVQLSSNQLTNTISSSFHFSRDLSFARTRVPIFNDYQWFISDHGQNERSGGWITISSRGQLTFSKMFHCVNSISHAIQLAPFHWISNIETQFDMATSSAWIRFTCKYDINIPVSALGMEKYIYNILIIVIFSSSERRESIWFPLAPLQYSNRFHLESLTRLPISRQVHPLPIISFPFTSTSLPFFRFHSIDIWNVLLFLFLLPFFPRVNSLLLSVEGGEISLIHCLYRKARTTMKKQNGKSISCTDLRLTIFDTRPDAWNTHTLHFNPI